VLIFLFSLLPVEIVISRYTEKRQETDNINASKVIHT